MRSAMHRKIHNAAFLLAVFFLLAPGIKAQTFFRTFGQPSLDECGTVVIPSPDGNLFVAGYASDSALIMKVSPNGNVIWTRTFLPYDSASYINVIYYMTISPDNYLVGTGSAECNSPYDRKGFFFRFDLNGNMQWCSRVNDTRPVYCERIMANSVSQYVLIEDIAYLSNGTYNDVVTARVDASNGNVTWTSDRINYVSSNPYIDDVSSMTTGRNNAMYTTGRIYIDGSFTDGMRPYVTKFDNTGNVLWSQYELFTFSQSATIYGEDLIYNNDSIVICYRGSRTATLGAYTNGLIVTDTLGNMLWSKDYDITSSPCEIANKVLKTPNGYLLIGFTNEFGQLTTRHIFVIATDNQGNLLWSKTFGSNASGQYQYSVPTNFATLIGNTVYFTGVQTDGTHSDLILASMDLDGNSSCSDAAPINVVESPNANATTTCSMSFYPSGLTYTTTSGTGTHPLPDECSFYHVDLGNDTDTHDPLLLDATVAGATYEWQDGSTQSTFTASAPGTYWVNVNINCCRITDTIHLLDSYSTLNVPNVFTPNGDGTNDFFLITTEGIAALDVKIYDRWGMFMNEITDPA
ncbi:MAG TPA: gliding motility-associated C-terminal domain-containing protein, partial [Bacteroidia bacterium]|nr:gliding motility-associated C-terminal domain-containing protein [Bacteroidia bacterium]